MKALVFLVLAVASAYGQNLCLPMHFVELNVDAVVLKANDDSLCESTEFDNFLDEEIVDFYMPPKGMEDENCRLDSLERTSCRSNSKRSGLFRVSYKFRVNLTCSDGCERQPETNKDTLAMAKGMVDQLRTAMRHTRKVKTHHPTQGEVVLAYFKGRKGEVMQVCQDGSVEDTIRDKVTLCSCPGDCQHEPVCPQGMLYQDCGTACPPTCEEPSPFICTLQCVQGCFCPAGLIQHEDECITLEECPTVEEEPTCAVGMVYQTCGSACPPTCDTPNPFCIFKCTEGCFCPAGMVEHNGACITPEECPTVEEEPTCAVGMVYQTCGSACPPTCDTPNPFCIFKCTEGCFCPAGMVEHEGECITADQCPVEEPTCAEGMVYNTCGSACPPTCDNLNPFCIFKCTEGCFCLNGMIEHDGKCITPEECPVTTEEPVAKEPCSGGMVYKTCASACPPTCDTPSPFCLTLCVEGCICPDGTVEHKGNCISVDDCPVEEPTGAAISKRAVHHRRKVKDDSIDAPAVTEEVNQDENGGKEEEEESSSEGNSRPRKNRPKKGKKDEDSTVGPTDTTTDDDKKGGKHGGNSKEDGSGERPTRRGRKGGRKNGGKDEDEEGSGERPTRRGRKGGRKNCGKDEDEEGSGERPTRRGRKGGRKNGGKDEDEEGSGERPTRRDRKVGRKNCGKDEDEEGSGERPTRRGGKGGRKSGGTESGEVEHPTHPSGGKKGGKKGGHKNGGTETPTGNEGGRRRNGGKKKNNNDEEETTTGTSEKSEEEGEVEGIGGEYINNYEKSSSDSYEYFEEESSHTSSKDGEDYYEYEEYEEYEDYEEYSDYDGEYNY